MMTMIRNLIAIVWKLPAYISIARAIISLIGTPQAKSVLEATRDVLKKRPPNENVDLLPAPERKRRLRRLREEVGCELLGLNETETEEIMTFCEKQGTDAFDKP